MNKQGVSIFFVFIIEELISRLDEVAKTSRILMLKTTLKLPYTSVFMELDCGYWSREGEAALRERMKN
jgi:hypothetical protein